MIRVYYSIELKSGRLFSVCSSTDLGYFRDSGSLFFADGSLILRIVMTEYQARKYLANALADGFVDVSGYPAEVVMRV